MQEDTVQAPVSAEPEAAEPAAAAPEPKKVDKRTKAANAADKLRAHLARQAQSNDDDGDDKPAAKPSAAPASQKLETAVAKLENAGVDVPDQKSGESDKQYELRIVRMQRELRESQQELAKLKSAGALNDKELAKLKANAERYKANPLEFFEDIGVSFEQLVERINNETYKAPQKRPQLPPEILEEFEALKRERAEREEAKAKEAEQRQFNEYVSQVDAHLKENAAQFPLTSALKGAAANIVRQAMDQGVQVREVMRDMEEALVDDAVSLVGSEHALAAALKKSPDLKARIIKALGLEAAKPPKAEEPSKSVASIPSESPRTTKKPMSKAERSAAIAEKLNQYLASQND